MNIFSKYSFEPMVSAWRRIAPYNYPELILLVLLAIVIYGAVFPDTLFATFLSEDPQLQEEFSNQLRSYVGILNYIPGSESASGIVFWGAIGAIVYLLIALMINLVLLILRQFSFFTYERQTTGKRWFAYSLFRRSIWVFLFLVIFGSTVGAVLPFLFHIFYQAVVSKSVIYAFLAIAGLSLNLYVLHVSFGFVYLNPRAVSKNIY